MVTAFGKRKSEGELKTPDSFAATAAALKAGHRGITGHHTPNHRRGPRHSREMPCWWVATLKGIEPAVSSFRENFQIYGHKGWLGAKDWKAISPSSWATCLFLSVLSCFRGSDRNATAWPGMPATWSRPPWSDRHLLEVAVIKGRYGSDMTPDNGPSVPASNVFSLRSN